MGRSSLGRDAGDPSSRRARNSTGARCAAATALALALTGPSAGCPAEPRDRGAATDQATAPRRTPAAPIEAASVFFVGHSLVNFEMPSMTQAIAESLGARMTWDAQIRIGGALKANWDAFEGSEGTWGRTALATGRYDTLVMTEAVSLDDMIRWLEPVEYGGRWYDLAVRSHPGARVFLYTTWHEWNEVRRVFGCARPGDFRAYIDEDRPKWEGIADGIARERPGGPPLHIVPGGEGLARVWDEARAGRIPNVPDIRPLFEDDIHLTPLGNYFVGLVQFATIFRRSPVGATRVVRDAEGATLVEVPEETARALQRIAWDVVTGYPRAGVVTAERPAQ